MWPMWPALIVENFKFDKPKARQGIPSPYAAMVWLASCAAGDAPAGAAAVAVDVPSDVPSSWACSYEDASAGPGDSDSDKHGPKSGYFQ
jgi:hypothetical protein